MDASGREQVRFCSVVKNFGKHFGFLLSFVTLSLWPNKKGHFKRKPQVQHPEIQTGSEVPVVCARARGPRRVLTTRGNTCRPEGRLSVRTASCTSAAPASFARSCSAPPRQSAGSLGKTETRVPQSTQVPELSDKHETLFSQQSRCRFWLGQWHLPTFATPRVSCLVCFGKFLYLCSVWKRKCLFL